MPHISALLAGYEPPQPSQKRSRRTERGDLLTGFLEALNASRRPPNKPLTIKAVSVVLSKWKLHELYALKKECEQARSFGALFWTLVKKKRTMKK